MSVQNQLQKLGIDLPIASKPLANYVGTRKVGNIVYVSGQLPVENSKLMYTGKVGQDISVEDAVKAAQLCAINVLSQLAAILSNDLDAIESCVRIGVYINSIPAFEDHAIVANGASDFIFNVLGSAGTHTRSAIGCHSLPKNVAVEVDAIFTIKK